MKNLLPFACALALLLLASLAAMADQTRLYGVRETVGSVEIKGWERTLVQGNPNLGHWHWTPMYANIQGLHAVPQSWQKAPPTVPLKQHYIKPIHLPLPVPAPRGNDPVGSSDKSGKQNKPSQCNDRNVSGLLHKDQVAGQLRKQNVSAQLKNEPVAATLANRKVVAAMLPKPLATASYGDNFDSLSASGFSGVTEKTSVHAALAHSTRGVHAAGHSHGAHAKHVKPLNF